MKGLLIKDFKLSFANGRVLYLLAACIILIVFCGDGSELDFIIYFVTAMCLMMVISTMSYDDYDNGMAFLLTLPITRRLYVTEKYVFTLLGGIGGFLVSFLGTMIYSMKAGGVGITAEDLTGLSVVCAVFMCVLSFMIPIRLKFGERGRIFSLLIVGILFASGTVLKNIVNPEAAYGIVQKLNQLSASVVVAGSYAAAVVVLVISWVISVRILEHKEI